MKQPFDRNSNPLHIVTRRWVWEPYDVHTQSGSRRMTIDPSKMSDRGRELDHLLTGREATVDPI